MVDYYDPLVPEFQEGKKIIKSISFKPKTIRKYDCVIVTTAHSSVDYKFVLKNAKLIFDTRNVYKDVDSKKITRL